jgi:regulatory protein
MNKLSLSIEQYCQYQERCHQQVRDKLYSLGANTEEVECLIATLIEKDLLNEQRFANAYTRGHFINKKWGRIKIKYALKQLKVSDFCISKSMKEIKDQDYENVLKGLIEKKNKDYKTITIAWQRKAKIQQYLLQKGYENELIKEQLLFI